jgi:hypothetical protein
MKQIVCFTATVGALLVWAMPVVAQEKGKADDQVIRLAEGKLRLKAPESWVRKKPDSSIIEHEFVIKASKGDPADGRLTVMGAGGSVEANIDRWYSQFTQPDGASTKERAKLDKLQAAGQGITLVDISGTFKEQRGPAAPATERKKYRMLAAIIATESLGNYFVKFYGPEQTVADNRKAFVTMIEGLQKP